MQKLLHTEKIYIFVIVLRSAWSSATNLSVKQMKILSDFCEKTLETFSSMRLTAQFYKTFIIGIYLGKVS